MKLIEYRIFMPLTVEENLIGQLWSFAEVSKLNTSGGEGVEIKTNELFEVSYDKNNKIIYENLPNYENESNSNGSSKSSIFKKSSSKDNMKKESRLEERSKSLDRPDAQHPQANSIHHSPSIPVNCSNSQSNGTSNHVAKIEMNNDTKTMKLENGLLKYGQYTHKIYKIASKLPWYVRKLLPKDSLDVHEKSWNMYPVVKTVLNNEFFKNNAHIELDTITRVCTNGQADENVHNLTPEQLEKREVVVIDITEPVTGSEYKADEDPTLFKSKTGRGPLTRGDWIAKQTPLICCYKLVCVEFKVFGLQTRAENYIKGMYKQLFSTFHRQVFCWMDKWCDLSLEEVRKIEDDLQKLLVKKIEEGEISNVRLIDAE